jgi:hypothetical protein
VSARSRTRAFTLLETLAAVAVLALVYVTLARVGMTGLAAEGGADRRLRAALAADERIMELEAELEAGRTLPLGDTEETSGDFAVHVSVTPLDLALPGPPEAVGKRLRDVKGAADVARAAAGKLPQASLFAGAAPGQPGPGRHVTVRVQWAEGAGEASVVRESYGLDLEVAKPILDALDAATKAEGAKNGAETPAGATPQTNNPAFPSSPSRSGSSDPNGPPSDAQREIEP